MFTKLLTCSKCKRVRYCSRECQKADWVDGSPFRHKGMCKLLTGAHGSNVTDRALLVTEAQMADHCSHGKLRAAPITQLIMSARPKIAQSSEMLTKGMGQKAGGSGLAPMMMAAQSDMDYKCM